MEALRVKQTASAMGVGHKTQSSGPDDRVAADRATDYQAIMDTNRPSMRGQGSYPAVQLPCVVCGKPKSQEFGIKWCVDKFDDASSVPRVLGKSIKLFRCGCANSSSVVLALSRAPKPGTSMHRAGRCSVRFRPKSDLRECSSNTF